MTPEQVEEHLLRLIYRKPFVPFVVEMADGKEVLIHKPGLAICCGTAGYMGHDGVLVEFQLKDVRGIRPITFRAIR
jgi:hypothetical protein